MVEGLTEFLPVSSTGHLILAARALQLHGEAVKAFEVVIQAGALAAVLGLYHHRLAAMFRGLQGRDPAGRQLLGKLLLSFLPAAVTGLLLHRAIKAALFSVWPVVTALAVGGVLMILVDREQRPAPGRSLEALTWAQAWWIGVAQCLALWPGTSRAMVTILAALGCGLSATAAAEYSFLLALPTLGAATVLDLMTHGPALWQEVGPVSLVCGYAAAGVVAALAIKGLIRYLTRHGLAVFGWYRLAVAAAVWVAATR